MNNAKKKELLKMITTYGVVNRLLREAEINNDGLLNLWRDEKEAEMNKIRALLNIKKGV